jgi:hypothetical protein
MQHVITLIHGTWAANARWLSDNSSLCRAIREDLTGEVVFTPFRWSGKNSFKARLDAAADLSEHLIEQRRKYPSANQFVIAHSHGGNVLLRVLEDDECPALRAAVFLSTPFLIAQERIAWHRQLALMGTAVYGIIASAFYMGTNDSFNFLHFAIMSVVAVALIFWLLNKGFHRAVEASRVILLSVGRKDKQENALLLRCDRDEATYGLTALQFVSSILIKLQRNIPRLYVSLAFYCSVGLAATKLLHHQISNTLILTGFILIPSLFVLIATGAVIIMALGLGSEFILASLLLDISVESSPLGTWSVCQIRPAEDRIHLRHSMSYEDENAVKTISDWLKSHV